MVYFDLISFLMALYFHFIQKSYVKICHFIRFLFFNHSNLLSGKGLRQKSLIS